MTNPFSSQGWSDKDYARAVGTLMGEAWGGTKNPASTLTDYELIADVIMNRKESNHPSYKGKSIDQLLRNAKEFSAWSKGQKNARALATKGMAAVLGKRTDKLTGITKQKYDFAVKALENVGINKSRRGNSYGSTAYNAPKGNKRSDYHEDLAAKHGSVTAGLHRATGEKFDPTRGPAPYSQYGEFGTPKEAIPPASPTAAPYSPAALDFGPDFTSPPSQARGPVTDPYGFSNINTAAEAVPGSFAGYGPNAFGALDQAPVDYGRAYPEISAGIYPDIAPPDVPPVPDIMGQFDVPSRMTEQEAIERAGLANQRPSENVERRQADLGRTIDEQVRNGWVAEETNDYLSALYGGILGPQGVGLNVGINPAAPAFTTNPYENLAPPAVYGPDVPRTYPEISAGMYPDVAPRPMSNEDFNRAFEGFPVDDATGSLASPYSPGFSAGTGAQLGTPDFAALSAVDRETAFQREMADLRDPAAAAARGGWSDQAEVGPRGYGPGGFASPAFDFESVFNATPMSGAAPANAPAQGAQVAQGPAAVPAESSEAFNARMSDQLSPGMTGGMSPFQGTPLGVGAGIIDQGPYSSPLGPNPNSFAPSNLAVSTQAPEIIGYEPGKAITREVPNPAWSDWSKDYATANASQNAWAAADEDKRAWDRAPPNPSVLADTRWAGLGKEPPKTIPETKVAAPTPIYSKPEVAAAVRSAPVASVPAVNAQPVAGSAIQAQPSTWTPGMTQQANAFSSLMSGIGGYGLQGVQGTFDTGFNLAGMGGGYGNFGGGYDPGGYGGYGGTAPGDAGYGSDARSGAGNMGAGNLYN